MEINQCWAMVLNQCCGKNYKKLWKLIRVKTKTIVLNQCQEKKLMQLIRVKPKAMGLNQCYEKNNGT